MMNKSLSWFVSRVVILIFSYLLIYFLVRGINLNSYEGDSLNYHIPIANAFLNGSVKNPEFIKDAVPFLKYSPGANEGILSVLIALNIPMNIFNVFGVVSLFFVCVFTGRRFLLEKDMSVIFAGSIVMLHTMTRWINTQVIDIWLGVWFVLILGLLQKPEKSLRFFAILGFASGMLIGSKYTGPIFLLILGIFYFRKIFSVISLKGIIAALIPFTLLGLSWYLRNYLVSGNPLYPQGFLFFKDGGYGILQINVWRVTLQYSNGIVNFINAIISEYGLWSVSILTPLLLLFKKVRESNARSLILIGTLCLFLFFFLPSDRHYNIAVSVFRYSYPAFITLILAIFMLGKQFKKENALILFTLANFLIIPELIFKPKLLILFLPVVFLVFYPKEATDFIKNKVLLVNKK